LLVAVFVAFFAVAVDAAVWDGSVNTSWYNGRDNNFTISTAEQLAGLAELVNSGNNLVGKTITLGTDIVLNDTANWRNWETVPPAREWTAIGCDEDKSFRGTFNGDGHVISGVYINSTSDYQGLFGEVRDGTIKNLGVAASYVKGNRYVGVLVGGIFPGNYIGSRGSIIVNSYATGNVSGNSNVGGLAGSGWGTEIINSYAAGKVTGTSLVGSLVGSGGVIPNSYYDKTINTQDNDKGIGKETTEMQSQEFVALLNRSTAALSMNKWVYATGEYPKLSSQIANISDIFPVGDGTENNPYIISTKEQLDDFSFCVNSGRNFSGEYLKLGKDIALNDISNWKNWATDPPDYEWTTIGYYMSGTSFDLMFNGTFDGDGHIISGVYSYSGLFKDLYGTIKNLGVVASYFKGDLGVGALAESNLGQIINSYATGNVSGTNWVGGLVGFNGDNGTITNSYASGTTTGDYTCGLACNNEDGTISNSYYNKTINTQTDNYGNGKTTEEMKTQSTYTDWDFTNIWGINPSINDGYPYLRVPTESITVEFDASAAYYGNTTAFNWIIQPEKTRNNIIWTVNGATINENNITFNAAGNLEIKATIENGLGIGKNYEQTFTIDVEKINPIYDIPTLTATYGQTLAEVTLPQGWSWVDKTVKLNNLGLQHHNATYTPSDVNNYHTIYNIPVQITVSKAPGATLSTPTLATKTTNSITINATTASTGQEVEYAINSTNAAPTNKDAWKKISPPQTTLTFPVTIVPMEYFIFARALENENYLASANSEPLSVWMGSGGIVTYTYCVLDKGRACLIGPYEVCPTGGKLSDSCPYLNTTTPILSPQKTISNISVKTAGNAIVLENLPKNAKIELYNLQGKRIYSANPENPQILRIGVQTKGIYILKINNKTLRVSMI